MQCSECSGKMACRFSVPVGKQIRYRHYKCWMCGTQLETVEQPSTLLGHEVEAIKELVVKGQKRRFMGAKMKKKGGG